MLEVIYNNWAYLIILFRFVKHKVNKLFKILFIIKINLIDNMKKY